MASGGLVSDEIVIGVETQELILVMVDGGVGTLSSWKRGGIN